jgi:hypothetical protein
MMAICSTRSVSAARASRTSGSCLRPASIFARYGREIPMAEANWSGLNPLSSRKVRSVAPTLRRSRIDDPSSSVDMTHTVGNYVEHVNGTRWN